MTQTKRRSVNHNQVLISGYMDGRFISGRTGDGEDACSFSVTSGERGQRSTCVRVNAYGALAVQCAADSHAGAYCVVSGELMNRPGKFGKLTEIRAKKVEFLSNVDSENQESADE